MKCEKCGTHLFSFLLVFFCFVIPSYSGPITPTLSSAGIISDPNTGLNWLSLTKTVGLSFQYVTSQLELGGGFYGWRVASRPELDTLFNEYPLVATGDTYIHGSTPPPWFSAFSNFVFTFGPTVQIHEPGQWQTDRAYGFYSDPSSVPGNVALVGSLASSLGWDNGTFWRTDILRATDGNPYGGDTWYGTFLVRDAFVASVPEPSTLTLIVIGGLISVIGCRWKARR